MTLKRYGQQSLTPAPQAVLRASAMPFVGTALTIVFALGMSLAATATASRADICVSCSQPEATYSCTIDGLPSQSDDARVKLYCITALAKSGGHSTCAVSRTVAGPCGGEARVLPAPDGLALSAPAAPPSTPTASSPTTTTSRSATAPAPQPANAGQTTVEKSSESKTVEQAVKAGAEDAEKSIDKGSDAVGSAAQSAGTMLQSAGKAVGDAAQKTWTCLSSLFGEC